MLGNNALKGLRIVVTRPEAQSASFIQALRARGADPIAFPVIRITPRSEVPGFEQAISELEGYDWLVFTSVNGVEIFWDWLSRLDPTQKRHLDRPVAAIGPATAEGLRERGIVPRFVPEEYVGESLGEGIPLAAGDRVLLPRAAGSRQALPRILSERGAQVDEFAIYEAVQATPSMETLAELNSGVDAITFTSPSTVRHFKDILAEAQIDPFNLPGAPIIACIGPITANAAEKAGFQVSLVADDYSIEGLMESLMRFFRKREGV